MNKISESLAGKRARVHELIPAIMTRAGMYTTTGGGMLLLAQPVFDGPPCQAEGASIYAEIFDELGYLTVERAIASANWHKLTSGPGRILRGAGRAAQRSRAVPRAAQPDHRPRHGAVRPAVADVAN